MVKVSVGCKEVDALLGGGVESSSITELYGEFRTGAFKLPAARAGLSAAAR